MTTLEDSGCPCCSQPASTELMEEKTTVWSTEIRASALVPCCMACDLRFTDERAEYIRQHVHQATMTNKGEQ